MKRVLVTGSEGFVGKHLVKAINDAGHVAWGVDKSDPGWNRPYALTADLADPQAIDKITYMKPDIIVHLASTCSTLGSVLRPDETFRDAVITNGHMLEAARRLNVPYLLTTSVKARDGLTPYGAAKRMNELWAIEHARAYGMTVVINRPGTIYGPGQEGSLESGWIAWFMKAKREGLPVTIYGDGSQRRDLLHVSDYVALLMQQIENPLRDAWYENRDPKYQINDVGGGMMNQVTVEEVAEYLGLEHVHGHPRFGDVQVYTGMNNGLWQPKVRWRESEVFQEFVPTERNEPGEWSLTANTTTPIEIVNFEIKMDRNLRETHSPQSQDR